MLDALALRLTALSERWLPDAYVFALLATLVVCERWIKAVPGGLVAVVGAIIVSWSADLASHGVSTLGSLPSGLPHIGLPHGLTWVEVSGLIATAVCGLVGPIFVPFFIVPKLDFLFWGWLKAFLQYSFIPVIAIAFLMIFEQFVYRYVTTLPPTMRWMTTCPAPTSPFGTR